MLLSKMYYGTIVSYLNVDVVSAQTFYFADDNYMFCSVLCLIDM